MTSEAFFENLNAIRAGRKVLSNAYLSRNDIERALTDPNTRVLSDNGLLALVTREHILVRLVYYADGPEPLGKLPLLLQDEEKSVVADVVGRRETTDKQTLPMLSAGFHKYSTFIRMSAKTITPLPYDKSVCILPAKADDAQEIVHMLEDEFDPLFAHIPSENEIRSALKKGEISAVYDSAKIVGFTYFEVISNRNKCLRYFIVRKTYRGLGIGGALLMNEFVRANGTQSYYLWIGSYNNTFSLYKRMGFVEDGLVDHIMTYHKEDANHGKDI